MGVNMSYSTALQGHNDTYLCASGSHRTSGTVLSWRTLRKWGKHRYLSFIMYPITLHFLFRTLLGLTLLLTVLVHFSVSSALLVVDVRKVVFGAPHHRWLTQRCQVIASSLIFPPTFFFYLSLLPWVLMSTISPILHSWNTEIPPCQSSIQPVHFITLTPILTLTQPQT